MGIGGAGDDTLSGGAGADQFVVRQYETPSVDTITDWDGGDRIILCGEGKFKYWVSEITLVDANPSDFDYNVDDVAIVLSNSSVIYVLNAAADFVLGDSGAGTDKLINDNPDDFGRALPNDPLCNPTCEVPPVTCPTYDEPVWVF